jgi:hypothetical protein
MPGKPASLEKSIRANVFRGLDLSPELEELLIARIKSSLIIWRDRPMLKTGTACGRNAAKFLASRAVEWANGDQKKALHYLQAAYERQKGPE